MPTDANQTPFSTLLPPSGYAMVPDLFEQETERQEASFAPAALLWPGHSQQIIDALPASGVIARLRYVFDGQVVTTLPTGTIALTDQWPHGLLNRYVMRLNGQSTPWNCRGADLNVLRQLRYKTLPTTWELSTVTVATAGTYPLRILWDIPLSVDPAIAPSGGGQFAQSVNSQIVSELTTGAQADVATLTGTATFTVSGQFRRFMTWFAIPFGKLPDGSAGMILPDLSVMHGLLMQEQVITQTGDNTVEINRVQGTIARLWQRYVQGGVAANVSLAPNATNFNLFTLRYATNQNPRAMHPLHVEAQMDEWYRGLAPYAGIVLFDALAENLGRDAVDVEGLANPQVVGNIASGVVLQATAKLVTAYEILAPLA